MAEIEDIEEVSEEKGPGFGEKVVDLFGKANEPS